MTARGADARTWDFFGFPSVTTCEASQVVWQAAEPHNLASFQPVFEQMRMPTMNWQPAVSSLERGR